MSPPITEQIERRWQRLSKDELAPEPEPFRSVTLFADLAKRCDDLTAPAAPVKAAPVVPSWRLPAVDLGAVLVEPETVSVRPLRKPRPVGTQLAKAVRRLLGPEPIFVPAPVSHVRFPDLEQMLRGTEEYVLYDLVVQRRRLISHVQPALPSRWIPGLALLSTWKRAMKAPPEYDVALTEPGFSWAEELGRLFQKVTQPEEEVSAEVYHHGDSFYDLPVWEQKLLLRFWEVSGKWQQERRTRRAATVEPVRIPDTPTIHVLWAPLFWSSDVPTIVEIPHKPKTPSTEMPKKPKPTYWQKVRRQTGKGWVRARKWRVSFRTGERVERDRFGRRFIQRVRHPVYSSKVVKLRPWQLEPHLEQQEQFEIRAGLSRREGLTCPKWMDQAEYLYRSERPEYRSFEAMLRAEESRMSGFEGNPDLSVKFQGRSKPPRRPRRSRWT